MVFYFHSVGILMNARKKSCVFHTNIVCGLVFLWCMQYCKYTVYIFLIIMNCYSKVKSFIMQLTKSSAKSLVAHATQWLHLFAID